MKISVSVCCTTESTYTNVKKKKKKIYLKIVQNYSNKSAIKFAKYVKYLPMHNKSAPKYQLSPDYQMKSDA